jgi:hypothetical protein
MWNPSIAVAIIFCSAQMADAEWLTNLEIVGEETAVIGSGSSCWVTLKITSNTGTAALMAWQLVLKVVPAEGAHGAVSIMDYAAPDANCVFSSSNITWSSESSFGSTFLDVSGDDVGSVVSSSGKSLIRLKLSSSSDAIGCFNIVLVPDIYDDDTGSNWVSSDYTTYDFLSFVSTDQADQVVASVNFAVPEPSSNLMLLLGAAAFTLFGVARKRLRRC